MKSNYPEELARFSRRGQVGAGRFALSILLLTLLVYAASAMAGENRWTFRSYAKEQYRVRTSPEPDETDQDLNLYLDAGLADAKGRFGADLSLGLWWDLDDTPQLGASPTFASVRDESDVWFDVFTLSTEYHSDGLVKLARAGRQVAEYGKPLTYDGGSLVLRPLKPYLEVFAFGGRTVHFFEVDADLFEDWIASVGAAVRPTRDLRLELVYRYMAEDTPAKNGVNDKIVRFSGWLRRGDWLRAKAYIETIDDHVGWVGGAFRLESLPREVGVDFNLKTQTKTYRDFSEQEDPFFLTLGESLPYLRFRADAWKTLTTDNGVFGVHMGFDGRWLIQGYDEEVFNRNFGKAYVLADLVDIGIKGPFLTFSFERWGVGPSFESDGLWTVGGSGGYDGDKLRVEGGTYYNRYRYQYYQVVEERNDVRTVFADLRVKPVAWLTLAGSYEFERFDRDLHTVTVGLTEKF